MNSKNERRRRSECEALPAQECSLEALVRKHSVPVVFQVRMCGDTLMHTSVALRFRINELRAAWNRLAQNLPSRIFDSSSSAAPIAYETQCESLNANCVTF